MKFTISSGAAAKPATENNQEQVLPEPTAEEFLQACMDLNEASADLQGILGEVKELDAVHTALRHAHNTLVDFESSAEAIKVLDLDGQLSKLAQVEAEMQGLQEAAAEAVEAVAQKIDAALEEQKEGLMAKFKAWCKQAWAAIKRFFGTIWTWLRGLFGHGTLLSWKEAQCIYDMEQGFAAVAKAIGEAFANPNFEEAMNNMAAKMAEAFADPKVQEKAADMDFSGGVTEATEGFKVEGLKEGNVYSYKAMQQALKFAGSDGDIRKVYSEIIASMKSVQTAAAQLKDLDDEKALEHVKDAETYFKGVVKVADGLNAALSELGKFEAKFDPAGPSIDITFTFADNTGKSPAQLGWNLKTCREYMQLFSKLCDGQLFNAEATISAGEKIVDQINAEIEKIPEGKSAAIAKVRSYMRMAVGVSADACKLMSTAVKAEYTQARYITRVLAAIKASMRKNVKKAA